MNEKLEIVKSKQYSNYLLEVREYYYLRKTILFFIHIYYDSNLNWYLNKKFETRNITYKDCEYIRDKIIKKRINKKLLKQKDIVVNTTIISKKEIEILNIE